MSKTLIAIGFILIGAASVVAPQSAIAVVYAIPADLMIIAMGGVAFAAVRLVPVAARAAVRRGFSLAGRARPENHSRRAHVTPFAALRRIMR